MDDLATRFYKDVAKHETNILHDDGVYRHVVCKEPNNSHRWFGITTWPGYLAITGDMGTHVFNRTNDMFTFFRGHTKPNFDYWSEKVEVGMGRGIQGVVKFSPESFKRVLTEEVYEMDPKKIPGGKRSKLYRAVREELFSKLYDGMDDISAHTLVSEFEYDTGTHGPSFWFHDSHEFTFTDFTDHFKWCCYAIMWAVKQYDELKEKTNGNV